jgi:2-methylisocitrate lyase-like PEP mutase family enzyme
MSNARKLREQLNSRSLVRAPGVYDGITARLVEQAGFPAAYMTGAGTSMSLGYPDYGLLTQSEMVSNAAVITRTIEIPLIADADTGYGNELNVTRTINEYERAGVAGVHIEDQVSPKRCGHLAGKECIPLDEYVAKIRAAVAARKDPDFVIIARTDANTVTGFEDSIERANAALDAGADVAFVESPKTMDEITAVPERVNGPCLLNLVVGGITPEIALGEAERLGYRIVILPSILSASVFSACDKVLADLKENDRLPKIENSTSVGDRFKRFHGDYWNDLRTKFYDPSD